MAALGEIFGASSLLLAGESSGLTFHLNHKPSFDDSFLRETELHLATSQVSIFLFLLKHFDFFSLLLIAAVRSDYILLMVIVMYVLVLGLIDYIRKVLDCCSDGSVNVRLQAVIALSKFFSQTPHLNCIKKVALAVNQRNADRARHRHPSSSPSGCAADSSR